MARETWSEPALTVRAACKRYSSHPVLKGLDMTVNQGCIYGLLGPSGCGKTTLFKCIVGRQYLDAGEIFLRSRKKHHIGYMPQEFSLYNEFSINETLVYYGMLYGMSEEQIVKRTLELVNLLSLPSPHRIISTLSGGQKRRLSFSIALLHNPELLILDEPTVGVDPILCHNIWQYLIQLTTKERKTIVITTHYIEEARQANMIGLMREGVLLAEESPQALIDTHQCDSLEQVFLKLSQSQSMNQSNHNIQECHFEKLPKSHLKSPLEESVYPRPYRVKAQNIKTMHWMLRNIPIMIFLTSLPIIQSLLFNVCIGRDPKGLHMGYINEEVTDGLANCSTVPLHGCHLDSPLSCRYLSILESKSMVLTEFDSFEDGFSAVSKNDVWGLIHFPNNYSKCLNTRLTYLTKTRDEDLDLSEVNVWMDMSDQYIGNMIRKDLYFSLIEFQKNLFKDCEWPVAAAEIPVRFKDAVFGFNKPVFTEYGSPATATIILFYMPMLFTTASLLSEKTQGLLDRNMVAGLNLSELLISHILIQLIINIIHIAIIWTINFAIFDFAMVGNWILFFWLCFCVTLSGMCYGFLVSSVCSSDREATVLGIGTFFPLTLLSGMMWPVEGMHYLLRYVSPLFPLTQSTEAYRAISARGWSLTHPDVYLGFLSSFLWIFIFLSISAFMVKLKNGTGSKH